jgi:hypothetical protein
MGAGVKLLCASGVLLAGAVACADGARLGAAPGTTARTIVVAELFTSEGCSSCPPADDVLSQLLCRQPIRGVEVLALGEHVDYWDRLGWRDPFSSAAFTTRQSEYEAQVFHTKNIYTPQLVVDGQLERVGSDLDAVQRAIRRAAQAPKAAIAVAVSQETDAKLRVDVHVDVPPELVIHDTADVLVAVTEDHLVTDVRRGENRGRTLTLSAVVRRLTTVGALRAQEHTFSTTASVPWAPDWNSANVRVISILQERQSRRVVGAGSGTIGDRDVKSLRISSVVGPARSVFSERRGVAGCCNLVVG